MNRSVTGLIAAAGLLAAAPRVSPAAAHGLHAGDASHDLLPVLALELAPGAYGWAPAQGDAAWAAWASFSPWSDHLSRAAGDAARGYRGLAARIAQSPPAAPAALRTGSSVPAGHNCDDATLALETSPLNVLMLEAAATKAGKSPPSSRAQQRAMLRSRTIDPDHDPSHGTIRPLAAGPHTQGWPQLEDWQE